MEKYICYNCGCTDFENGTIDKVYNIDGKYYSVENIPALICQKCQEPLLTAETTEKIRIKLHGHNKPLRTVTTDVYDYAS